MIQTYIKNHCCLIKKFKKESVGKEIFLCLHCFITNHFQGGFKNILWHLYYNCKKLLYQNLLYINV